MKRFLSILLTAVMLLSLVPLSMFSVSAETDEQGVEYTLSDDETYYIVSGCDETVTRVIIPTEYNGLPVIEISEEAFAYCYDLISVVIPDSVISIGDYAFCDCYNLTSIEISDSVTSIGNFAFSACYSLTSIEIPDSVTSIGGSAFYFCDSLTSIEIPASVTSIGNYAFSGCSSLESITVSSENTVYKSVDNCLIEIETKTLIAGCENSVIPTDGSVTSIGDYAFFWCDGLTSIVIPDSVTSIGVSAFGYCVGLTSIEIPDSLTSIGEYAFCGCVELESITVSSGNTVYKSIDNCLIETETKTLIAGCKNSVIPTDGSVTSIGDYAFESNLYLTSIVIPDSITGIGEGAFYNCMNLTDIYCKFKSQPDGWNENWNDECPATVHWGYEISSDDNDDTSDYEPLDGINVALNKSYTGAKVSLAGNYAASLTDGVASTQQDYNSNWFALYYNKSAASSIINAPYGIGEIIIELDEVVDGITDIRVHVWNHNMSAIATAKSITAFVSNDYISFTKIGELDIPEGDEPAWATLSVDNASAKYVKLVVETQDVWTFFNEIEVYADPDYVPDDTLGGGTSNDEPIDGINVALGKNYTGGKVSPINPDYSANLTDGQASEVGEFDSNWYAFYYNKSANAENINAPNGVGRIVIDLEEVVDGITNVRAHVWNCNSSGVLPAKSITLFVSEDGEEYTEVGKLNISDRGEPSWATISTDDISARYVILVFETQGTWTFLNEIEVYADPEGGITDAELGDIDADGDVDATDYILVKRAVLKNYTLNEKQSAVADIDKDGDVDAADYVLVKRIVLGTYKA